MDFLYVYLQGISRSESISGITIRCSTLLDYLVLSKYIPKCISKELSISFNFSMETFPKDFTNRFLSMVLIWLHFALESLESPDS